MPGCLMHNAIPNPLKLLLRVLVTSTSVFLVTIILRHQLAQLLVPITRFTIDTVQSEFAIQSVDAVQDLSGEVIRVRANLVRPVEIGGRMFYPVGYGTSHSGGFQVTMTLGGMISYSIIALIISLAWPTVGIKEIIIRALLALPLMFILLLTNIAITFSAELWTPIHNEWIPDINWSLLQYSRVLMGGGGLVAGLVCGALVIVVSRRIILNMKQ